MIHLNFTPNPTLPATSSSPSSEPAKGLPAVTLSVSETTVDLKTKQITREDSASNMTKVAEQLAGNTSSNSGFLREHQGDKHVTPWKLAQGPKLENLVNLYQAAVPLIELSVKEPADIGLIEHYYQVREHCKTPRFQNAYPFHHDEKTQLDRFVGSIPYRHNCVALKNGPYINASMVEGVVPIIMTQAPIPPTNEHPGTFPDFWQMVWEKDIRDLVMLNRKSDEEYWPAELIQPVAFGNIEVTKIKETLVHPGTIQRSFSIRNRETGERRDIIHRQMVDWPDRGVPTVERLIEFIRFCRQTASTKASPFIVHCNYGAGRTGTFVLLYNILSILWSLPPDSLDAQHVLNFPSWLLWMRRHRANAVSEESQMILIYQTVRQVVHQLDQESS